MRDRRSSLLARAKKRFGMFAARGTDRTGNKTKMGSLLELCGVPRFPARPICEHEKLKPLIISTAVDWRGFNFPNVRDIVSQHESTIALKATEDLSVFEANIWGMLFYCTQIEGNSNGTPGIHL
ncbi:MAG: hypothetical protein JWO91_3762 [Acidobacteriaceae bacterium]|nr:hypothetical protein [Acidobacteriaceae bacterium]